MEIADAPRGRTARRLREAATPPWRAVVTVGCGSLEKIRLSEPDGDDHRSEIVETLPCVSETVRLAHTDGHRAVACWASLDGGKKWTVQGAWRWTPPARPTPINVLDLIKLIRADRHHHQLEIETA